MAEYISEPSIDDEGGQHYELATDEQSRACRRRFEGGGKTVLDPNRPGYLLHGIGNWWDGPTEVRILENGDLEFTSPYTGETDRFNANGYYRKDGSFSEWSKY